MNYLKTFTERHAKPKDRYSYDLNERTRLKMLHILQQHNPGMGRRYDFIETLNEVHRELLKGLGQLSGQRGGHPVIDHLSVCSTEEALAVFVLCFQTHSLGFHGEPEEVVEEFNRVLEADAVGYELTEFKRPPPTEEPITPAMLFPASRKNRANREYPKFIKKGERTTHEKAVQPALEVLSDPRFATANKELLKAFEEVRKGDYTDAITDCGSAFESVMKTICAEKGWTIDPNKDASVRRSLMPVERTACLSPFTSRCLSGSVALEARWAMPTAKLRRRNTSQLRSMLST